MRQPNLYSVPWDRSLWLRSRARRVLTSEAKNIYQELCHECFTEGSVPDDQEECRLIAGVTQGEMERSWLTVRGFFKVRRGRLFNETATEQRTAVLRRFKTAQESGVKGAAARRVDRFGSAKPASSNQYHGSDNTNKTNKLVRVPSGTLVHTSDSDSDSSPGLEVESSNQEKPPPRAREVSADGNGRPEYDCVAGWERVVAVCQRPPVAPQIIKARIARDLFFSDCETPEREAEILAAIERLKASGMVERGFIPSLENMFRDGALNATATFAPPAETESDRERRRLKAL